MQQKRGQSHTKINRTATKYILDSIIRRILLTPPTTPREVLQLETGIWDIESMIYEKQLMYYHRITKAQDGLIQNTAMDNKRPLGLRAPLSNFLCYTNDV